MEHSIRNGISYAVAKPLPLLSEFVESFWMIKSSSESNNEIVLLPDGRFDIIFSYSEKEPFHATLLGLGTKPERNFIPPKSTMVAISFKLLAIEYLLDLKVASVLNDAQVLPDNFWEITEKDLKDFESFCNKASEKMISLINPDIDTRKQKLFDLIYSSEGTMTVAELSKNVFWSSRQINRYFNEQFGIPLKSYCNILRFRSSLNHIKKGELYPDLNFTDQNHFIKEVKKFSGVAPGELAKNQNDRFILLSALPEK